jgi:hypothetical protein
VAQMGILLVSSFYFHLSISPHGSPKRFWLRKCSDKSNLNEQDFTRLWKCSYSRCIRKRNDSVFNSVALVGSSSMITFRRTKEGPSTSAKLRYAESIIPELPELEI